MIVTKLFRKPYNIRFQDFLERLACHEKLIKDEMLLNKIHDDVAYQTEAINAVAELLTVSERGASICEQTKELLEKDQSGNVAQH